MALESWRTPVQRGGHNRHRLGPLVSAGRLTYEAAVGQFLFARERAETTRRNLRHNLLNSRLTGYLAEHGVGTIDRFTAELAAEYLRFYRQDAGAGRATVDKVRRQLVEFAAFCRENLGHAELDRPPLTTFRVPARPDAPPEDEEEPALTRAEADMLVAAAAAGRDRTIVELLLYTGIRPSELVALTIGRLRLDARPPYIEILGTSHHRSQTKSEAGFRRVPLDCGQRGFPARLRRYLEGSVKEGGRPRDTGSPGLFLSSRRDAAGGRTPLTLDGMQRMLDRLTATTGIHANPYRFRHTFCTWAADAGMPELALMQIMGWKSREMATRYYRGKTNPAILELASRIRF
jgi:integrase